VRSTSIVVRLVVLRRQLTHRPIQRLQVLQAPCRSAAIWLNVRVNRPICPLSSTGDARVEDAARQRLRTVLEPFDRPTDAAADDEGQERREHDQGAGDEQEERAHRNAADGELERRPLVWLRNHEQAARGVLQVAQHLAAEDKLRAPTGDAMRSTTGWRSSKPRVSARSR
jgi:hypothetical protein